MAENNKNFSISIEDIAYRSPNIGLLESLDYPESRKRSNLEKFNGALRKIIPGVNHQEIVELESVNNVILFKKLKAIFSLDVRSSRHGKIVVIYPSGHLETLIPTFSTDDGEHYLNTYKLDVAAIGLAVPKNSDIKKIIYFSLSEEVGGLSELIQKKEEVNRKLSDLVEVEARTTRDLEINSKRVNTLRNEKIQLDRNLEAIFSEIKEKENNISDLNNKISELIEERGDYDKRVQDEKSELDVINKEKVEQEKNIELKKATINSLNSSVSKLKHEITELSQKKSLFDNELSGFNVEGKRQSNIYILISYVVLVLLTLTVYITFERGFEFLNYPKEQKMLDILISRIPLTVGISLIISMCFGFAYFLINQAIKINSDRMKFIKASIIAKDIWIAAEAVEDLTPYEREKLRQQTKLDLISKVFHDERSNKEDDTKLLNLLLEKLLSSNK